MTKLSLDDLFKQFAEYSQEADVTCVYLNPGRVAYSKFLDDLRVIDFGEDGRVVGIEFLQV